MIIVIAAISVFIATRLVANTIQERLGNQLVNSARSATNVIVEIEEQHLAVLRQLTFTDGVGEAMLDSDVDRLNNYLNVIVINERLDELIVFDANGQNVYRASNPIKIFRF